MPSGTWAYSATFGGTCGPASARASTSPARFLGSSLTAASTTLSQTDESRGTRPMATGQNRGVGRAEWHDLGVSRRNGPGPLRRALQRARSRVVYSAGTRDASAHYACQSPPWIEPAVTLVTDEHPSEDRSKPVHCPVSPRFRPSGEREVRAIPTRLSGTSGAGSSPKMPHSRACDRCEV